MGPLNKKAAPVARSGLTTLTRCQHRRDAPWRVASIDVPGPPMTLGNALDNKLQLIVGCEECGHSAPVDVAALVDRLRHDFAVPDIENKGRCETCGERRAWVRVSGYRPPHTT
jgi:hypothetical protein